MSRFLAEHITVAAARLNQIVTELLPQPIDLDFDHVAVLVSVVVVDMLAELRLREHLARMQHEAAE